MWYDNSKEAQMPEDKANDLEVNDKVESDVLPQKPDANKKKYVILAVIAVLVVAVIVVTTVLLMNRGDQEPEASDDAPVAAEDKPDDKDSDEVKDDEPQNELTPEEKVQAIVERIRAKIASDKLSIKEANYAPDYRAEGMKVFTSLDKGFGLTATTVEAQDRETENYLMSDAFANLVIGELASAGFEGYYNLDDALAWGSGSYLNPKSGVVCQIAFKSVPFSLWCGHTSWISEGTKVLVNELAEAVEAADSDLELSDMTVIGLRENTVEDSEYKPYQRMMVSLSSHNGVGGAAGLFYRTSPEAKWQFFAGAQGLINCGDYKTADLQKAYMGEACWDEEAVREATVKVK